MRDAVCQAHRIENKLAPADPYAAHRATADTLTIHF